MLIDIRRLLKGEIYSAPFTFDYTPGLDEELKSHGVKETGPIHVTGEVKRVGDELILDLSYEGSFVFGCSRCLEDAPFTFKDKLSKSLVLDYSEDPSVIELLGAKELNLEEVLLDEIIIQMPMQVLCKEECKGLCPECGTDLNVSSCSCADDKIDPRFEALKDLFSN